MFKSLVLCLFLGLSILAPTQITSVEPASAFAASTKAAAHHLGFSSKTGEDSCSSVAVGPHTILTAAHCIIGTGKVTIDDAKTPTIIEQTIYDETDHVLLIVDQTFQAYVKIDEKAPKVGDTYSFWGWPGSSDAPLYREGVCTGRVEDSELFLYKIPAFPGDSGSGVIDAAGDVISVVSLADKSADMAAATMAFTPAQLSQVR